MPSSCIGQSVRVRPIRSDKDKWVVRQGTRAVVPASRGPLSYEVATNAGTALSRNRQPSRRTADNYSDAERIPMDDFAEKQLGSDNVKQSGTGKTRLSLRIFAKCLYQLVPVQFLPLRLAPAEQADPLNRRLNIPTPST